MHWKAVTKHPSISLEEPVDTTIAILGVLMVVALGSKDSPVFKKCLCDRILHFTSFIQEPALPKLGEFHHIPRSPRMTGLLVQVHILSVDGRDIQKNDHL